MSGRLRRRNSGDRFGAPVEMRFIDMFMAALGALIFLAMLLSLLLQHIPSREIGPVPEGYEEEHPPLRLLTRTIPPATVGTPYFVAFAYRGGAEPIRWEVVAGVDEIKDGLTFSPKQGVLQGTPERPGLARFVLRVFDGTGGGEEQAFELEVAEPAAGGRRFEMWFAGLMWLVLFLFWRVIRGGIAQTKRILVQLEIGHRQGLLSMSVTVGQGISEEISLADGGLQTYQERLNMMHRISRILGWVIIALACWFAWRLFFSS